MKWRKLGLLYNPEPHYPWMKTHASNPVLQLSDDGVGKLYFSSRDENNRAHISAVTVDFNPPFRLISVDDSPVLSPGAVGLFDDSGVSLSCITQFGTETYLYYLGWNLGVTVPWRNSIGAAKLDPASGRFEKVSLAPILDRNPTDPYSLSYPFVFPDGENIHVYYGSNLSWGPEQTDMAHLIKYAQGHSPTSWEPTGEIAVDFKNDSEYAISRPCVLKDSDCYRMWYSYRGEAYRIGYAESSDAQHWTRFDERAGIEPSPTGWDSEMICYPFVFDYDGNRYLIYNGNRYGVSGIGVAICER